MRYKNIILCIVFTNRGLGKFGSNINNNRLLFNTKCGVRINRNIVCPTRTSRARERIAVVHFFRLMSKVKRGAMIIIDRPCKCLPKNNDGVRAHHGDRIRIFIVSYSTFATTWRAYIRYSNRTAVHTAQCSHVLGLTFRRTPKPFTMF